MNILIAPDSFKQSLDAIDVCCAIESGFKQIFPDARYTLIPMADGGEGTTAALSHVLAGQWRQVCVHDPLMRQVLAKYLLLPKKVAVIEIAEACGLHLLTRDERNPLAASSYGVGEMIIDALNQGAKRIIIGLGGSATNDAGVGMLMALGIRFYDHHNELLAQGGAALATLHHIDASAFDSRVKDTVFEVACDVTNPLCGALGASAIFGPQKGADFQQVALLDKALANFATVCAGYNFHDSQSSQSNENDASISDQDYRNIKGAGAAGGLGFALLTFCGAKLASGFEIVAKAVNLSEHIGQADLVITGEGKLDAQTAMGKVLGGISQLAKQQQKPLIAICGAVDGFKQNLNANNAPFVDAPFDVVMPSIQKVAPIEEVMKMAYENIETTATNIAAAIRVGQNTVN